MIKKLLVWLLRDCPMLGQVIKISYNSVKTPKAKRKMGYWIGVTRDCKSIDIHESLVFTVPEFQRIMDRLYVKNMIPELLPAGYGVPQTTKCIFESGKKTVREEDRTVVMVRVNWVGVYLVMTKLELDKARERGMNCNNKPKLRWWHKIAMKIVNKIPSYRPEFKPYDWSKRPEMSRRLGVFNSRKGS